MEKDMVKIHTVGGFSEVGKNMLVVELEDDAFIFDEGFFLPAIVSMQEQDRIMTENRLKKIEAIPQDSVIDNIRHKVRAQFISHAHLDHVGAIPFLSDKYDAPIYGTPFTIKVLESLLNDNDIIFVDISKKDCSRDGIYAINTEDGLLVKRVQKLTDGTYDIISDNDIYNNYAISRDELTIYGKVIGSFGSIF